MTDGIIGTVVAALALIAGIWFGRKPQKVVISRPIIVPKGKE